MKQQQVGCLGRRVAVAQSLALGSALLGAVAAQGQTAAPAGPALEEVLVTAQRRESSAQDVGASISVLSGDLVAATSTLNTEDLQSLVPGLVVSRDIGLSTQIFIRGIGNNLLGIGSGNSVATYIDGVYIPNSVQVFQSFNDLERIEVLKGPQAVLYGRNATGGTLLINSKAPSFTPSLDADLMIGSFSALQARASASGALVSDRLAGRIAVQHSKRDGYSESLSSGKDQDYEELDAIRGELLFSIGEDLTVRLAGDYVDLETGDFKKGVNPDGWMYQLSSPEQYSPDPRGRYQQFDSSQPSTDSGGRLSIAWASAWGDVTSVTSYRDYEVGPVHFDNDSIGVPMTITGLPFQISFNGNVIRSNQLYHESFIATDATRRLSAIVGFNWFKENSSDFSNRYVGFALARNFRELDASAFSVYADLDFSITDTLSLIVGARYNEEEKEYSQTGLNTTTNLPISFAENDGDWSETTPRFGLEYRPDANSLYYVTATNGFKSGGFNESNPSNIFDPETVWAYEAGMKRTWDNGLRTNVSAFYYEYEDLQVQQIIIPSFARLIRNAASAELYGLDLEVAARVTDGLTLGANLSLLHSKYGDFEVCIDLYGPCTIAGPDGPILNPVSNVNVEGNQMANAPEATALLYGDYVFSQLPFPGSVSLHVDVSYRSELYFSPYEVDIHKSDAYALLGAELKYESDDGTWFVGAFGRNLTDELYETWIANVSRFLGPGDGAPRYVGWGAPRTYGVRAGIKF